MTTEYMSKVGETLEESNKRLAEQFGSESNSLSSTAAQCITSSDKNKVKQLTPSFRTEVSRDKGKISFSKVDKRVSLTCTPRTKSYKESKFAKKIRYVLGTKVQNQSWMTKKSNFYGLLYNALSSSAGLIFPYTPSLDFQHSVNYESTEITHSNLAYNSYKNTPPPTIGLSGKFTADNRDNALHMLSAIWFCIACTKCEFGENTANPGLPPPVLYLSGYDSLVDNIPVVITNVAYKYPQDLHYVNLVLDMNMNYNEEEEFCSIYDTTKVNNTYKYVGPINNYSNKDMFTENYGKQIGVMEDIVKTEWSDGLKLSFWLPTELELSLQLKIQPNLLKVKKQWDLDDYKTGILLTPEGKSTQFAVASKTKKVGLGVYEHSELSGYFDCKYIEITDKDGNKKISEGYEAYDFVTEKYKTRVASDFIPSGWTW